jgi:5-methylcytosine-specific restriction endonuclease McrA
MRTPNCKCVICDKPMYRRPYELKKVRFVACFEHRAEAQVVLGQTKAQKEALKLGRPKGTNHLEGMPKSEASNQKRSISAKQTFAEHPHIVIERGEKIRGENHYRWNGGISKLNESIRRMTENRKWMDAIKERDGVCVRCGSVDVLESHHLIGLAKLIEKHGITNRDEARNTPELWKLDNGITLCQKCHYAEHGRNYEN